MSSSTLRAQSEQLFRYLFEQASLGIAVEDLEGTILLANPALCSILGYHPSELCGMHCSQFANPEDSQDDWGLFQQLRAGSIDHYSLEKRYVRKDGSRIWGRLNVSMLRDGDSQVPLVFAFVEDITERKHAEHAISEMNRKLIEAQDQERVRIARDLHDDIGQRLALMAAELEQLQGEQRDPRTLACITALRKQAVEVSTDIQFMSHELHSAKLEYLGISAAMRSWCAEFGERQRVEIAFRSHDVPSSLPREVSLCLFRVLQEGLHNAAKHSGTTKIEVDLWEESGQIHLTVNDSGRGFDVEAAMRGRGIGLASMQERVRLVNGAITIQSTPMRGNSIHARVPFAAGASSQRAAG